MDPRVVEKVCAQIYNKFPEVAGSRPKIQAQSSEAAGTAHYLLIFHGSGTTADGKKIARTVRVVCTERGKVIKITTSR